MSGPVLVVLNSILLMLAIPSFILTGKALLKSHQAFVYAREQLQKPAPAGSASKLMWKDMTLTDKVAFYNMWHITTLVGDISLVVACSTSYIQSSGFLTDKHER
jgi:hypothetical protein